VTTILFVDDESAIRRAAITWLQRRGFEVHGARSLLSARRCLRKYAFDGAFVDLWLGDGSGFELYSYLQEHYPHVARNTVFVSGDLMTSSDTGRELQALGQPLLSKPFDLADLERHVRAWKPAARGAHPELPPAP
jgi:DNA-binding NtrC family response regulator